MKPCNALESHLNRIQGQINALKEKLKGDHSCSEVVQLALSAGNSFQSLRSKLIEEYVKTELIKNSSVSPDSWEQFLHMLKLAK